MSKKSWPKSHVTYYMKLVFIYLYERFFGHTVAKLAIFSSYIDITLWLLLSTNNVKIFFTAAFWGLMIEIRLHKVKSKYCEASLVSIDQQVELIGN